MRTLAYGDITWHDDPNPTEKDLLTLQKKYDFHQLDVEDCLSEHERPKVEEYDKYLFLVFHIPYVGKSGRIAKEEVNVFLGTEFIVTLHEGKIPIIDDIWKELQASRSKRTEYFQEGAGFFMYELMHQMFETGFPIVDVMMKELRRVETELFDSDEGVDMLRDIMNLKRNIITLRSILLPQRTLLAILEHKNRQFVSEELALYFDNILDAIERQISLLDTAREMIDALQDTHESWLSYRTNTIVRVLTIASVTMLPLTLISGLYGMNVNLPLGNHPMAFFFILVGMVGVVLALVAYFAKKRWL